MIPKRIFYVWGAGEPKKRDVNVCIQTWRQIMPDYEIIELNQDDKRYFDYEKECLENKWFSAVYEHKLWAFIADYIRIKVLYDHGGVYMDTDASALRTLDDLLDNPAFVGFRNKEQNSDFNYVEPAILAAQKGNPFLKEVLDFYAGKSEQNIWNMPIYVINHIFKHIMDKDYKINEYPDREHQKPIKLSDITVYPETYFCPLSIPGEFFPECLTKDSRTIHWWGSSWHNSATLFFMNNKHKLPLDELNKMMKFNPRIIFLFGWIPIGAVLNKNGNTIVSLFGLSIIQFNTKKTRKGMKNRINLFGLIPIIKVRTKNV